jgi:peroxiredoxin
VALGPGDPAPDLPLLTSSGKRTTLAALRGEAVLLVFLRHLG